jgi:hypothetical protein
LGVDPDALRITVTTESAMTGLDPLEILWRHLDEKEVQMLGRAAMDAPPSASAVLFGIEQRHDRAVLAALLVRGDVPPVVPHG